ncbi:MAG: hypothetical protein ACK5Y2_09800 [Bdellovibrionales bacterium]
MESMRSSAFLFVLVGSVFSWAQSPLDRFWVAFETGSLVGTPNSQPLVGFDGLDFLNTGEITSRNRYGENFTFSDTINQKINPEKIITALSFKHSNFPVPCVPFQPNCSESTSTSWTMNSRNGQYHYYLALKNQRLGFDSLTLYRKINNTPFELATLYDLLGNGYGFAFFSVNDEGTAAVIVNRQGTPIFDLFLVDRNGVVTQILTTQSALSTANTFPSFTNIAINNRNNVFVNFSNGLYAINPLGQLKRLTTQPVEFEVIEEYDNSLYPEGLVYYREGNQIRSNNQGEVVFTAPDPMNLLEFDVNDSRKIAWIGQSRLNFKRSLWVSTELLYETGNLFLNLNLSFLESVFINASDEITLAAETTTGKRVVLTNAQTRVKLCRVEDVTGKRVEYYAQTNKLWATDPLAGIPTELMYDYGCTTTNIAMLMNFYRVLSSIVTAMKKRVTRRDFRSGPSLPLLSSIAKRTS